MKRIKTYDEEALKLSKAIDIAIVTFRNKCPKNFNREHQKHFISCYTKWKNECLHPENKFKNLTSLKYYETDVFTYFQESSGLTVEYFWNKTQEENLDYKRINKLEKILKRGKIKGRIEYEYVTDIMVVAEQIGMTSKKETEKLNEMIHDFEFKKKNN